MAILTLTEAKSLMQINSTKFDTTIEALIPIVQDAIIEHTHNHFEVLTNYNCVVVGSTISFDSETKTINDSDSDFVNKGFVSGLDVKVWGSKLNDGIYKVTNVSAGSLAVEDDLIDELADNTIMITLVKFPKSLKLAASKMIAFDLEKSNMEGLASRSLGDYSESYSSSGEYPKSLISLLKPFRKTKK